MFVSNLSRKKLFIYKICTVFNLFDADNIDTLRNTDILLGSQRSVRLRWFFRWVLILYRKFSAFLAWNIGHICSYIIRTVPIASASFEKIVPRWFSLKTHPSGLVGFILGLWSHKETLSIFHYDRNSKKMQPYSTC